MSAGHAGEAEGAAPRVISRRQLALGGLAGAAGLLATWSFVIERRRFRVDRYRVPVADLPPSLDGLSILQLSDLHHGDGMSRDTVEAILDRANAVGADLIVLTGDYVGEGRQRDLLEWILPQLRRLRAPLGVHAVLGNHDHWAAGDRGAEILADLGLSLVHDRVAIERDDGRLWLAGTGDLWEDRISIDEVLADVDPGEPRIVLAHNPDTADRPWRARVDLMLSGHTHGGQVVLPFVGAPRLPVRNKRYASGLIATDRTQLFVTRGLGWSILPVRFNCPPELAVLELARA